MKKLLILAFLGFCLLYPLQGWALSYSSECSDWHKKAQISDAVLITEFKGFKNTDFDNSLSEGIFRVIYALKGDIKHEEQITLKIDRKKSSDKSGILESTAGLYYAKPKDIAVLFLKKSGAGWVKTGCLSHIPLESTSLEDKGNQKLLDIFIKPSSEGKHP